jgi:hypothetical protein
VLVLSLALACADGDRDRDDDGDRVDEVIGTYEMGWPIDACSVDMPDEGTGYAIGDTMPQYSAKAQTGETVKLHDFCNQVVYLEIGYFT